MKIGCAIPFDIFHTKISEASESLVTKFDGADGMLCFLKDRINSIELRAVTNKDSRDTVYKAAALCRKYGFEITIHATLSEDDSAESFFAPYQKLFKEKWQDAYNLTIHALEDYNKTVRVLSKICDAAVKNSYPVFITLENQRSSTKITAANSCKKVLDIKRDVASDRLGFCWDLGHYYSNASKFGVEFDLPPSNFAGSVSHTHIHAMYDGMTHFPLDIGSLPMEEYLGALVKADYAGILCLELDYARFLGKVDFKNALENSIFILKTVVGQPT